MRHIPQQTIDEARDAIRFGASAEDIAGKLGIGTEYLMQLLRTDSRPQRHRREKQTVACNA